MKTETGYAADLQAIADQIDRREREIAALKDQLIDRLAEINTKDNIISLHQLIEHKHKAQIAELEGQLATALREREGR